MPVPLVPIAIGGGAYLLYKMFFSGSGPSAPAKLTADLSKPVATRPAVATDQPKPKVIPAKKAGSPAGQAAAQNSPTTPQVVNVVKVVNPNDKKDQTIVKAMKSKQVALKKGDTGPSVIRLQVSMGETTNGIFDDKLEFMVKELQKAHGLKPDGLVGPKTWAIFKDS